MTNKEAIKIINNMTNYKPWEVEALYMAIKALEQTSWVPCSEKLPEEYIHVLCQFCMGGMSECYYAHGYFHVVGGLRITTDEVLAWMPLPQPYKAEEER